MDSQGARKLSDKGQDVSLPTQEAEIRVQVPGLDPIRLSLQEYKFLQVAASSIGISFDELVQRCVHLGAGPGRKLNPAGD